MQKILVALDPLQPDKNALDFACFLGRLTKSRITGAFLENRDAIAETAVKSSRYKKELSEIETNIAWFKETCTNSEVSFKLHRDRGIPAREMITESRFSDMIVMGADTSFSQSYEGRPTTFVKDVLMNAECPVIISPDRFDAIDEIIFSYNGTASSVFAIKQFTYLFPQLDKRKITLVQINKNGIGQDPERYYLMEWLKDHYTDIHIETRVGDPDTDLFEWLFKRKNTFVVMGAYGRSALSRFFKRSHADLVIHLLSQPLFITHL